MARAIILDCDPGLDDAVAILLAHGSPDIELLAVSTVGGNQSVADVTRNALAVATVAGLGAIPVAAGCGRPLLRQAQTAAHIHGTDGLGGLALPDPAVRLDPRHAVTMIVETVLAHGPGEVTLVPTGPLTNIALAARLEPRIVERVREVVLMGGGYHTGNATPVAEFNIHTDPHAADIVFGAGWPVVMVGLDLTHQAVAGDDVLARLQELGTRPARFVAEILGAYGRAYAADGRGFTAPPVHDPCAVAYVADPTVLTTRRAPVTISLEGPTIGMTVTDLRRPAPADCPTAVATHLHRARFWDLVLEALARLGHGGG